MKKTARLGGFLISFFSARDELEDFFGLKGCASRGLPTGGKGHADDGKEGIFRLVVLVAVEKFRKGVFKIIGVHHAHLKAIIGDEVGFVKI